MPFKYESTVKILWIWKVQTLNREYPTRPIVGAGALILENGKLLLIRRGAKPGQGRWSIPGGLVELGELVQNAVVREVKEECGLDIEVERLIDVFDSITRDEKGRVQYQFVVVNFLAKIKGGILKNADDVLEARWTSLNEVEKYNLTNAFRAFFQKHHESLKQLCTSR
ncbi:MAG: NUDIX hydrolase [Candidatus Bathyarchaeota archaeon]|nr:NUDIX hydrolase [Candidatus Bathyarchaeota archaeon]